MVDRRAYKVSRKDKEGVEYQDRKEEIKTEYVLKSEIMLTARNMFRYLLERMSFDMNKIKDVTFLYYDERVEADVGDYSYGKLRVYSHQKGGKILIGSYTSIAEIYVLMGGNHHMDVSTYPFKVRFLGSKIDDDNKRINTISIGNDCWIGHGVTILDGVSIGDGAIIGANAVVASDVEPYSMVVGNPARVIRKRFSDEEIDTLKNLKYWTLKPRDLITNVDRLYSTDVSEFKRYIGELRQND